MPDWEWAGLHPPFYDEGFLWFALLAAPGGRAEVEAAVDEPLVMLMSALLVQLWHLQWYVADEYCDAQLANRDQILARLVAGL